MKRTPAHRHSSPKLAVLLGCLFFSAWFFSAWSLAQSSAGTLIRNVATATYSANGVTQTASSDEVTTIVSSICRLSILPNGDEDTPAHELELAPNDTAYLPYILTNTGNDSNDFDLSALTESSLALSIFLDQNANGVLDEGEAEVNRLEGISAGEDVQLLLEVEANAETGTFYVNLAGACRDEPNTLDNDNLALIRVEPLFEGAGGQPLKEAEPPSGSAVYPGLSIRYTLSFSFTNAQANVSVTDVLSPLLGEPSAVTQGQIVDEETGLTAQASADYDSATRTLAWQLDSVPAGMTVRLGFEVTVQDIADLPPETLLENVATVNSPGLEPAVTNTVFHDLRPVAIDLEKTVSPLAAQPGDVLDYRLTLSNPQQNPSFERLNLTDLLPDSLTYIADSSVLTLPDGSTLQREPREVEAGLVWTLPGIEPGETLRLDFKARVKVNAALSETITNRASVAAENAPGRTVAQAVASAVTQLEAGVLSAAPVLLGHVFIDHNRSGIFEPKIDTPLEGVRLYLSDGSSVLSDEFGRYTFMDLRPGLAVLRVDPLTAPPRFYGETATETKEGLWRLRLDAGLLVRQDIPFEPPFVRLNVRQTLRVETGPVRLTKSVFLVDGTLQLRFDVALTQAVARLRLEDALPGGAVAVSGFRALEGGAEVGSEEGLELTNLSADYTASFVYDVNFSGQPAELLLTPEITWEQP